jgi:sRNA-binding protein
MHEGLAQLAELYPNCFRQPRQPLKIGIHNDVIARHPELRPSLIASALKTYTRSLGYLEMLKAGSARIDLEGNLVGTVTDADEEDAKRKIAKAARRAAAKAIEARNAADQPAAKPVAERPGQQIRSRRQNLNSQRRPNHHVSGWLASRRPRRLAARGSSPRSDLGYTALDSPNLK